MQLTTALAFVVVLFVSRPSNYTGPALGKTTGPRYSVHGNPDGKGGSPMEEWKSEKYASCPIKGLEVKIGSSVVTNTHVPTCCSILEADVGCLGAQGCPGTDHPEA